MPTARLLLQAYLADGGAEELRAPVVPPVGFRPFDPAKRGLSSITQGVARHVERGPR